MAHVEHNRPDISHNMPRVEHNRADIDLISQKSIAMCTSYDTAQCQRLSCSFHSGDIIVLPAPVSVFRRDRARNHS
jgi:hypothetical protein